MTEKRPAVSVIVPCYNCAGTVEQTLDSLAAQTLKNMELVVINDDITATKPEKSLPEILLKHRSH